MARVRRPGPLPLGAGRTGRKVRSPHWFRGPTGDTVGTGTSWASALLRCSITGETLVVRPPKPEDTKEWRRVRTNLGSVIHRSAKRRALKVAAKWEGDEVTFQVVD